MQAAERKCFKPRKRLDRCVIKEALFREYAKLGPPGHHLRAGTESLCDSSCMVPASAHAACTENSSKHAEYDKSRIASTPGLSRVGV
jgi:hypothetical protein